MLVIVRRQRHSTIGTIGQFLIDSAPLGFTCERGPGPLSVPPRIPSGTYQAILKPVGSSRFDDGTRPDDYLKRFGAFSAGGMHAGMIELIGVPHHTEILVHIGNSPVDTEGCILVGSTASAAPAIWIGGSEIAYKKVYPIIRDGIMHGQVHFAIEDDQQLAA